MNNFLESLLIIIVIYNRALEDCESFQSVLQMTEKESDINLYIYDNSKLPQKINDTQGVSMVYNHDSNNSGVSRAYNQGAFHAQKTNKKWILLLDQDTTLPSNILKEYKSSIDRHPDIKLFVPILLLENNRIFSPCVYKFKRGFHPKSINVGVNSLNQLTPVNSGMLINLDSFLNVGGYNDKIKLDFSDFQFIERFRQKYSDFYVLNTTCRQDFSNDEVSYSSQINRFRYYCNGARNIDKPSFIDKCQYGTIVFLRAIMLTIKYRKLRFLLIFINSYLKIN
ncbi:glycosyltransferase family 2 protein [Arenibacter sp. N53]|uniref:glycosyltransferase n=1 Tax=Arenibacter TaxID=178469 RepID=UPI000CD3ED1D|nr:MULTISPECIES: glycosyltransferase [Arenibacter]MCM4150242.1 glycosyltransferase family 2 protein [Arenibacter sp. N53]